MRWADQVTLSAGFVCASLWSLPLPRRRLRSLLAAGMVPGWPASRPALLTAGCRQEGNGVTSRETPHSDGSPCVNVNT